MKNLNVHSIAYRVAAVVSAIVSAVLLLSLAGCGQPQAEDPGSKPESRAQSQDAPKSSVPKSDTSGKKTGGTTTQSSSGVCIASQLKVSLSQGQGGAAGSVYPNLVFTNASSTACTTKGFPGVSLQAGGKQIGAAAERDSSVAAASIRLKPGESAHATLKITNAAAFDAAQCNPQQADSVLVYPPDQKQSIRVQTSEYTGCSAAQTKILTVRVLQAGAN